MSNESQSLELGSYTVLQRENGSLWELGKGSYGTTYKAEHKLLRRVAALKVINDHLVRDDTAKLRFLHEAQAAASLDHQHIARVHDFGEANGTFYYAMGYCSGGDLENFCVKNGPQPWSVVRGFALQILSALKAAHDKGLLHRDLKPSNVMLADEGEPVSLQLIDFGLVKVLDSHNPSDTATVTSTDGAFMGNPLTASPEQFREEDLDERSDLFSLGITLWYLLHGGSPFGNVAAAKIAHQRLSVANYDELLPQNLDEEARRILAKLIVTDREKRFRYAQEVIDALRGDLNKTAGVVAVPVASELQVPFEKAWKVGSLIRQFSYGSYYFTHSMADAAAPPATFFVPEAKAHSLGSILEHGRKLVKVKTARLCAFTEEGVLDGTVAFLCQRLGACTLQTLLQKVNRLNIHQDLGLLKQVARAADEAAEHGLSGVEMGDADIFLTLDASAKQELRTLEEWAAYFEQAATTDGSCTSDVQAVILPRLVDDVFSQEAHATIGGDDLASNPLSRFAGFLYRVLSGMTAKQTAYLSTINYVSFSDISEESNQYLSHVLTGTETPLSATALLHQICQNEGGNFDGTLTAVHRKISPPPAVLPAAAPTLSPSTSGLIPPPLASASGLVIPPAAASTVISPVSVAASASGPPPLIAAPSLASTDISPLAETLTTAVPAKKKRLLPIILAAAALLVLGGLGTGCWYAWQFFSGKMRSAKTELAMAKPPAKPGTCEIQLPQISLAEGTKGVPLALQDAKGAALGELTLSGETGKISGIPLDIFQPSDRWPLRVTSSDAGFQVSGDPLEQSLFEKSPGEDQRSYGSVIRISARATALITPRLTFQGEPVSQSTELMQYLVGVKSSKLWNYQVENGGMRITLAEGQRFPVEAELNVPFMKTVKTTLKGDGSLTGILEPHARTLSLTGITAEHRLAFEPDLSQVKEESLKELLRGKTQKVEITGATLLQSRNRWTISSIPGTIKVEISGQTNAVPVAARTTHLVFVNELSHLPTESKEMTELRLLAERGGVTSQYNLGVMFYKTGKDVLSDRFAFGWFKTAADEGDLGAKNEIGRAYLEGIGTEQNHALAVQWLSEAAEAKHRRAIGDLARCYEHGYGVPADLAKAEELYLQAANLGDLDAMCNIGILYLDGKPANKEADGAHWLQKAATSDHPYALYSLGFAYLNGVGLPADRIKAKQLLTRASELGNSDAKQLLSEVGN